MTALDHASRRASGCRRAAGEGASIRPSMIRSMIRRHVLVVVEEVVVDAEDPSRCGGAGPIDFGDRLIEEQRVSGRGPRSRPSARQRGARSCVVGQGVCLHPDHPVDDRLDPAQEARSRRSRGRAACEGPHDLVLETQPDGEQWLLLGPRPGPTRRQRRGGGRGARLWVVSQLLGHRSTPEQGHLKLPQPVMGAMTLGDPPPQLGT